MERQAFSKNNLPASNLFRRLGKKGSRAWVRRSLLAARRILLAARRRRGHERLRRDGRRTRLGIKRIRRDAKRIRPGSARTRPAGKRIHRGKERLRRAGKGIRRGGERRDSVPTSRRMRRVVAHTHPPSADQGAARAASWRAARCSRRAAPSRPSLRRLSPWRAGRA